MAIAPTYTPQTRAPQGSGQRLQAFDSGAAQVGAAANRLGRSIQGFAEAEDDIQQHHDALFARKQAIEFRREVAPVLAEYDTLKGDNAIVQAEPTRQRLRELREKYLETASNPRMKQFLDDATLDYAERADTGIVNRSLKEKWTMDVATTEAEMVEDQRTAIANWIDPDQHEATIMQVGERAKRLADLNGLEGTARVNYIRGTQSAVRKSLVRDLVSNGDLESALTYYEANRDDMTVADRSEVDGLLVRPKMIMQADAMLNTLFSGGVPGQAPVEGGEPEARVAPVEGARVTDNFSAHTKRGSAGLDLAAPEGSSIRSTTSGEVIESRTGKTGGNFIRIRQADGTVVSYMHMEGLSPFKVGDQVTRGDVIGTVGMTGRTSGPHLHMEVKGADGKHIDPEQFLEGAEPIGSPDDPRLWDRGSIYARIDALDVPFVMKETLRERADLRIARDQQIISERERLALRQASEWILENQSSFTDPKQIPPTIWGQLSPSDRLRMGEIAAKNREAIASGPPKNGPAYHELRRMSLFSKDDFVDMNLGEFIGVVNAEQLYDLQEAQMKIRQERAEGRADFDPLAEVKTVFNTQSAADDLPSIKSYKDELLVLMGERAQEMFVKNGGKPLTQAELIGIYNWAVDKVEVPSFFGLTTAETPRYQDSEAVSEARIRSRVREDYRAVTGEYPDEDVLPMLVKTYREENGLGD